MIHPARKWRYWSDYSTTVAKCYYNNNNYYDRHHGSFYFFHVFESCCQNRLLVQLPLRQKAQPDRLSTQHASHRIISLCVVLRNAHTRTRTHSLQPVSDCYTSPVSEPGAETTMTTCNCPFFFSGTAAAERDSSVPSQTRRSPFNIKQLLNENIPRVPNNISVRRLTAPPADGRSLTPVEAKQPQKEREATANICSCNRVSALIIKYYCWSMFHSAV